MRQHGRKEDIPAFDPQEAGERFESAFVKAQNIADGALAPIKVPARVRKQMGLECLVAKCPKCNTVACLSGEGRHLCRTCFTWLLYVREG